MIRGVSLYLEDIVSAINKIEKYTKRLSFNRLKKDEKTIDAVIRNLEIIGEAAKHLPKQIKEKYFNIPWKEIVGMRNKVIHEYFGVDVDILWGTINEDIPDLKRKIRELKSTIDKVHIR